MKQASGALLAGTSLAAFHACRPSGTSQTSPRIAVIGAGLAGLTAAWYLQKAGLSAEIYESTGRVGGRVVSAQNLVADGITTELGGEFIDSTHTDMLAFCRDFGLKLWDMKAPSEKRLVGTDYFFGGRRISENEILAEFRPFAARMKKDIDALPGSLHPWHPKVIELDRLSIDEYLRKTGMSGWLYDLLTTSFTSELGLPSGNQSSLNLLVSLNTDTTNGFEIYGESDERFKVVGGNEQILTGLQKRLKTEIRTGFQLQRLKSEGTGYRLAFDNGREITADFVILTVPFSVLREVEIRVLMPKRKRNCIRQLGYGTQSKLLIGVDRRLWRDQGFSGYVLSDRIHNGWDSSQMQRENRGPGAYSLFLGADKGEKLELSQYDAYLDECNRVFPGLKEAANGRKNVYNWNRNPMTRGAYACYRVGQVSGIGQAEAQPVGNLYFAGEHCSRTYQGFMNGAAETGRSAAGAIVRKLSRSVPKPAQTGAR